MAIGSFVALGDSFTEGLDDPRAGQEGYLGWADRFAGMLAGQRPGLRYANLAVRGKLLREVAEEQRPVAPLETELVIVNEHHVAQPGHAQPSSAASAARTFFASPAIFACAG